jgi:hypothetical protein
MDAIQKYRHFTGNATELAQAVTDCANDLGLDIDTQKTNERLVRYYQTEGVLDRPERQGRDSAYHFRHLVQVLNARRMVANGLTLATAVEFNSTRSTDELVASLKKPLPNAAELLVSKFKGLDAVGAGAASQSRPQPNRPPMAVVDVLDEVKIVKKELLAEIQALMQLKGEVNRLRDVLIHSREKEEQEGYKMEQLLDRLHRASREFEDMFRESMIRQREAEERLFYEQRHLLQKISDGQQLLADRIELLEKKLSSL